MSDRPSITLRARTGDDLDVLFGIAADLAPAHRASVSATRRGRRTTARVIALDVTTQMTAPTQSRRRLDTDLAALRARLIHTGTPAGPDSPATTSTPAGH